MKDYSSWILKNPNYKGVELLFDEEEMSIQRDLRQYNVTFLLCLFLILSSIGNLLSFYENFDRRPVTLVIIPVAIVLYTVYELNAYFKARRMNKRVYPLSGIKTVQTVAQGAKVRVTIEFKDGTKDGISTLKNHYYKIFIDLMKKNSIEVIERTKG